ncbi:hypothetical protein [Conchiformibius steedae]|uniref:hypothetical protein n=1 Tax=Conchiformibius steedae TaxID=153493 RepID=UPI0026E9D959|nr:hypothetical protein [Conchiformibius steedae]
MPVSYALVNHTKKHIIRYLNLPCSSRWEITNHAVAAAITTWYLFEYSGDQIIFVDEHHWNESLSAYEDQTHTVIDALIKEQILTECEPKKQYIFPDDECWFRNVGHHGTGM